MKKQVKPDFSYIFYDKATVVWGHGNNIGGLPIIERIRLRENNEFEDEEERKDWLWTKNIYDKYINIGQLFNVKADIQKETICKITYVNFDKQTINWKMINMQNIAEGMKPPAGKWSINGFLAMFKSGEIFIKEVLK